MSQRSAIGRLFCFGLGYTATRLGLALVRDGWTVAGTCTTAPKASVLARQGIEAHVFDGTGPMAEAARALDGATHVLGSAPPTEAGDPVLAWHGADLAALSGLRWAGYLSTTGVYGDRAGGWVDEDSARTPSGPRGVRRMTAEDAWLELWRTAGVPVHLFRLAGIYGPGRSALDRARAGTAARSIKPGHVFSRIHVDDAVAVLRASMARPDPGTAYNLCDDRPAAGADVTVFACRLLGIEPPPETPFAAADLSAMARSFYDDNKRVRNGRIKTALGVALRYPDYQAGLRAVYASSMAETGSAA